MENREPNKRKGGRPTKEEKKLSSSISLKLTEADFKKVREKAKILGIKASQYGQEILLKGSIKSRFTLDELDLMRKLSGMANNLNQIARRVNRNEFKLIELDLDWLTKLRNYSMIAKNIKGKSSKD